MEKIQVKIKRLFEKREGESERGKWCYQDMHIVEDTNERYPNEYIATMGTSDAEVMATLKEGDTIKINLCFGTRCYQKDDKTFWSQTCHGWGVELVQPSAF